MSRSAAAGSRVVFVGNIPYDFSETQLIDIFSEVGSVVSFRLVFDRETGKPKGFGFCTYQDAVTAASAVRNLNGYDVGGRQLRVDYADAEREDQPPLQHQQQQQQQLNQNGGQGSNAQGNGPNRFDDDPRRRGGMMPQPAPGPTIPNTQQQAPPQVATATSATDAITQIISALQPAQLVELMSHLKVLLQSNPEQCRILLIQNPQLAYAIFQALLAMNIVDQYTMQRILQTQTMSAQQQQQPSLTPGAPVGQMPGAIAPVGGAPGIVPAAVAQQAHLANILEEQQKQLLIQVLNMTPDQIAALPTEQQQQILLLRAQVLGTA